MSGEANGSVEVQSRAQRVRGLAAATLLIAVGSSASLRRDVQAGLDLPAVSVLLSDWGLNAPSRIRLGRVSLIHETDGPRLDVRLLRDHVPPRSSGRFRGEVPGFSGHTLVVADFLSGSRNRLGGYFNSFQRSPSVAEVRVLRTDDGRRALTLRYRKEGEGFGGAWLHLFDYTRPPTERRYLDARTFSTLSFWVRGSHGGEQLVLKLADAEWEEREDAMPLGHVHDFLPGSRIEPEWQQAVVPLERLPRRLDRSLLASLVFEVVDEGAGEVLLSGVAFSVSRDSLPPLPAPVSAASPSAPALAKATWVWNTAELLDDPAASEALFGFLAEEGFDRVYLQLPEPAGGGELDARLGPLVAALQRHGLATYALDGAPAYALPAQHTAVLRTIDEVIRHNAHASPAERFHGIHYDIEPYLLPGFHGPRRESILRGYLELVAESARRAREAGLIYGVDIPFWYDVPGELTHEPVTVAFEGVRKLAHAHVIDLVDEVTVMDYRTLAFGVDGVIRHGEDELAYAAARGKRVFIGLETHPLPDEELIDFAGPPQVGLPERPPGDGLVVLAQVVDSARVFLLEPNTVSEQQRRLRQLAIWLRHRGANPEAALWWQRGTATPVPGDKLSFSRLGRERLGRVMAEAGAELAAYPSFAGFALHHAASYRELLTQLP